MDYNRKDYTRRSRRGCKWFQFTRKIRLMFFDRIKRISQPPWFQGVHQERANIIVKHSEMKTHRRMETAGVKDPSQERSKISGEERSGRRMFEDLWQEGKRAKKKYAEEGMKDPFTYCPRTRRRLQAYDRN